MDPLFNRGCDYVENIPTLPAVRAQLYRIGRKEQRTAVEPKNSQDIEIMDDDVIMEDSSSFLLADDDSILKQAGWNPNSITMDFEVVAIKELERHFPSVNVLGYNFHFNQCFWRQVQSLGLVRDYKEDEEIRLHIRMFTALAYLPENDTDDTGYASKKYHHNMPNCKNFWITL
ncbi:hypothetical protein AVEN_246222-1 [Araneus ventricosus]|uniref:Uncharacterized protein n=1 Tax=Araneus ventricosus TaxID=182803 RepID=A0A4Y2K4B7_ARAVE|nr:hypothetical protein AVEN_246222-1 [Araneus ventricosus]